MTNNNFSFYLQNNNTLFNSDVLTICYMADEEEVKKYGLTSPNIVLFIKMIKFQKLSQVVIVTIIVK